VVLDMRYGTVTSQRDRTQGFLLIALATLLTLAATFAFSAATADPASAQQAPICAEYPGLPQCEGPTAGGGDTQGSESGGGANALAGSGGATGEADGTLPFTGYPLTPLLLLLLLLLVTGLTIRAYLAIRDRVRARGPGTPTGTA
jgi:hypothetical protein